MNKLRVLPESDFIDNGPERVEDLRTPFERELDSKRRQELRDYISSLSDLGRVNLLRRAAGLPVLRVLKDKE